MKAQTYILSLGLLLAGSVRSPACWTLAWDPQGPLAVQQSQAVIITPFNVSPWGGPGAYFDQLGFYDATGAGLTRDVVVGIWNTYGQARVTIPAGPATREDNGFRWAYLDEWFILDPFGENYLYYEGEAGDLVRLANRFEVQIHPLFELAGNGYDYAGSGMPAFMVPRNSGIYAFGANGQYIPEPSQYAMMLVTLLGGGVFAWRRRVCSGK